MLRPVLIQCLGGFLALFTFAHAQSKAVYLFELTAYTSARLCVQSCADTGYYWASNHFGCEDDICRCGTNVGQSTSVASLCSSCALGSCADQDDASTAVEIWADYCSMVAEQQIPVNAQATTTAASNTAPTSGLASPGSTRSSSGSQPTGDAQSNNGGNDGTGGGSGNGNGNGNTVNGDGNTVNLGHSGTWSRREMTKSGYDLMRRLTVPAMLLAVWLMYC